MASIGNVQSYDASSKQRAWVEAHTEHGRDVLDQLIAAEHEAANELGYMPGENWENDPKVAKLALSRF